MGVGGEPKSLLSEIPRVNSSGFGLEFWTNTDTHNKYPETSWGAVVFSLILAGRSSVGGGGRLEWKFLYVILKLCAEFQFPTMTTTGQKVCGVAWWLGCPGITFFSL